MKKTLLSLLLILLTGSIINAQFTKIGGGITGSTGVYWNDVDTIFHKTGNPAITISSIYELTLPIHIAPSFTYFLPRVTNTTFAASNQTTKQIVSCMMFDVNGHYVFNSLDRFEFYGLAGLNVTFIGMKWVSSYLGEKFKSKEHDSSFGLNLGAGTYMKLTDQFDLYGEVKYVLSKYDQVIFNVGVLINIDWLKKNENPGL